ncbi:MAG: sigma-70 family RNA polymerase sigma factor [Gemmatimonadota bacterium]
MASELLDQAQTAAASLGARSQEVFELRCLQGLSVDETADAMGIAPGSVRQQLCRARARLRSTTPTLED